VLKITEVSRSEAAIAFKLEGKVLAPWVDELRRLCTETPRQSKQIHLDLDAVTFLDESGAELMRELVRQGITIARCSEFVSQLLRLDKK
jgi:anti-anti-sigma regulatory factor